MLALPEVLPAFQKVVLLNRQVGPYYNMTTGIDTFYTYPDTWKCQRAYFNSTLYAKLPWYNEELYYKSQTVYAPVKGFLEGNFGQFYTLSIFFSFSKNFLRIVVNYKVDLNTVIYHKKIFSSPKKFFL